MKTKVAIYDIFCIQTKNSNSILHYYVNFLQNPSGRYLENLNNIMDYYLGSQYSCAYVGEV